MYCTVVLLPYDACRFIELRPCRHPGHIDERLCLVVSLLSALPAIARILFKHIPVNPVSQQRHGSTPLAKKEACQAKRCRRDVARDSIQSTSALHSTAAPSGHHPMGCTPASALQPVPRRPSARDQTVSGEPFHFTVTALDNECASNFC